MTERQYTLDEIAALLRENDPNVKALWDAINNVQPRHPAIRAVPQNLITDPQPGEVLTSFRGEKYIFVRWDHYKVVAYPQVGNPLERTFYAGVLGVADPRLADAS